MRMVLALVGAMLLTGCFFEGERCKNDPNPLATCSYGFSGVSATATYANVTWERAQVAEAIIGAGFTLGDSAANVVVGTRENETFRVTRSDDDTTAVVEFDDDRGLGYTREEVEAMADASIAANTSRAGSLLANLERQLGWARAGELRWASGIMVI